MKILFGILLFFFVSGCAVKNLSTYTTMDNLIYNTESVQESAQKNFKITLFQHYFYITNSKNEKQIIASDASNLYKFDQHGNLIDTLNVPDKHLVIYIRQPENNFIYLEDGYIPNWVKTGDKTKRKYDKVYNQDLTMDTDVLKQYKEDVRNFEYKDPTKPLEEFHDYLYKKAENFELLKLIKSLNE